MFEFLKIIALCIGFAILYGIIHDQITARLCLEYFTEFHPRIIESTSPTILALVWGILAMWWVGLGMGILLASSARFGNWTKLSAAHLVLPIARMLVVVGFLATMVGAAIYFFEREHPGNPAYFFPFLKDRIPKERHIWFYVDLSVHNSSYFFGSIGSMIICVRTVLRRRRITPRASSATR